MAWRRSLPYKGGREDSTTFPKISSTRQHFSSIRQHFLKFLRLDNISRRFGNLFLFPVKIENVVDSFLVDSTTFLETCSKLKMSSTRQHFSSIRQHFRKSRRLDNISRRFDNISGNVVDSTRYVVELTTFLRSIFQ